MGTGALPLRTGHLNAMATTAREITQQLGHRPTNESEPGRVAQDPLWLSPRAPGSGCHPAPNPRIRGCRPGPSLAVARVNEWGLGLSESQYYGQRLWWLLSLCKLGKMKRARAGNRAAGVQLTKQKRFLSLCEQVTLSMSWGLGFSESQYYGQRLWLLSLCKLGKMRREPVQTALSCPRQSEAVLRSAPVAAEPVQTLQN